MSVDLAGVLVAFTFRGMTDITTCVPFSPFTSPLLKPNSQPEDVDRPYRLAHQRPLNQPFRSFVLTAAVPPLQLSQLTLLPRRARLPAFSPPLRTRNVRLFSPSRRSRADSDRR